MGKEVDGTLLRLVILRVLNNNEENKERPIRKKEPDDVHLLVNLIMEVKERYAKDIKQMRFEQIMGSPDFEKIKKDVIRSAFRGKRCSMETINYLSSCISTYFSLSAHLKSEEKIISLKELRQYSQLFLQKAPAQLK